MCLDVKAQAMLAHYKRIIEEKSFDEYDILGFLIFIRSYLKRGKYKFIFEFSNLIAHRNRNRGLITNSIKGGAKKSYKTKENSRFVIGYSGMSEDAWENEWKKLGKDLAICIDTSIILEITMCVFSLSQFSEYTFTVDTGEARTKEKHTGKVILFLHGKNQLSLHTTEIGHYAPFVCFARYGPYKHLHTFDNGRIDQAVETFRENGELHLRIAGTDTIIV